MVGSKVVKGEVDEVNGSCLVILGDGGGKEIIGMY